MKIKQQGVCLTQRDYRVIRTHADHVRHKPYSDLFNYRLLKSHSISKIRLSISDKLSVSLAQCCKR